MSENRKKVAALVGEKITAMKGKVAEAASLDDKFAIYNDYTLFFNGLDAGIKLAGGDADDAKPIAAALASIDADSALLEALADE